MSENIIRHGSIMQDVLEESITPPDIVDKMTVKHGSSPSDAGGGSLYSRVEALENGSGCSNMVEKVLFDQSLEFRESQDLGGMYMAGPNPVAFQFIPGKAYKIEIEGESFDVVGKEFATEGQTVTLIGNLHYAGIGDDTGEPFAVQTFTLEGVTAMIMVIAAPATYDAVNTVTLHVKLTTMEEKSSGGSVVRFYVDSNEEAHCSETFADAKRLIFEEGAAVTFSGYGVYSSAVYVEMLDEGNDFEEMSVRPFSYTGWIAELIYCEGDRFEGRLE